MAGKYLPLEKRFMDVAKSINEIELSFDEIERILKSALPSSAYEDRRWWDHQTEGNHVNKRAWTNAGWKISDLDVQARRVKFIRA